MDLLSGRTDSKSQNISDLFELANKGRQYQNFHKIPQWKYLCQDV